VLDKAEYSAFESTLNSPIVSYRIVSHIPETETLKQFRRVENMLMRLKQFQCFISVLF